MPINYLKSNKRASLSKGSRMELGQVTAVLNKVLDREGWAWGPMVGDNSSPPDNVVFERTALSVYVRDALDFPNARRKFWTIMAEQLSEFNAINRRSGKPEFRIASYPDYLRIVDEVGRQLAKR